MSLERHYRTAELVDLLSVSAETLRRAAANGEIQGVTSSGRDLLWPESEVQAWLDRNKKDSRVVQFRQTRRSTTRRRTA